MRRFAEENFICNLFKLIIVYSEYFNAYEIICYANISECFKYYTVYYLIHLNIVWIRGFDGFETARCRVLSRIQIAREDAID